MKQILAVVLLALCASQAAAWWGNGHMIVAKIAQDVLQAENPELLDKAIKIINELRDYTELERDHPFVECSTFPDEIKRKGWGTQSHWHFVDNPYVVDMEKTVPPNKFNVTWAIGEIKYALKYARPRTIYDHLKRPGVSYIQGDSMNMRFLIHYVGDIHQPLHATERYTPDFPNGDRGGNSFKLETQYKVKNLHSLWDSGVYKYKGDSELPLTYDAWNQISDWADAIKAAHPKEDLQDLIDLYYTEWDDESFQIAKDFVYKNIEQYSLPSDDYVNEGQKIVDRRLALGGYRLAKLFQDMWADLGEEEVPEREDDDYPDPPSFLN